MDTDFQIQSLKSQIESMKLQIGNIEIQNKSMMMSNLIGEQLFNLSIQLFNTGIQAFNIGKKIYKNANKELFYKQLGEISNQINSIIKENENEIQQKILSQQIIMNQQFQSNQFMTKNIIFNNATTGVQTNIKAPLNRTMQELFKQYVSEVYGITKKKITFFYDSNKLSRDDQRKIGDIFCSIESPNIIVIESGYMPKEDSL